MGEEQAVCIASVLGWILHGGQCLCRVHARRREMSPREWAWVSRSLWMEDRREGLESGRGGQSPRQAASNFFSSLPCSGSEMSEVYFEVFKSGIFHRRECLLASHNDLHHQSENTLPNKLNLSIHNSD